MRENEHMAKRDAMHTAKCRDNELRWWEKTVAYWKRKAKNKYLIAHHALKPTTKEQKEAYAKAKKEMHQAVAVFNFAKKSYNERSGITSIEEKIGEFE